MKLWKNEKKTAGGRFNNNNRINLVIAIIFLFGGLTIFKLFSLQVINHAFYVALASGQHDISSMLEPKRGRIFYQDRNEGLYPVATNKNFALIYAIPVDVEMPKEIAEQLFVAFRQADVEKEVDFMLKKEEDERLKGELALFKDLPEAERKSKEDEAIGKNNSLLADKMYIEMKKTRREDEIKIRKETIVNEYLSILSKENDPWEPLVKKVDEDTLKKLYSAIYALSGETIGAEKLELKDNAIYYKNDSDQDKEMKISGIGFVMTYYRYYPEGNIGAHLTGFVGPNDDSEQRGKYGLEEFFDEELYGKFGVLKAGRDARGQAIITDDREYQRAEDGNDIILTIDHSIQYTACKKLNEAVLKHGADGGSVIIIEPKTGAILAMCSAPDFDPNNYQNIKDIKIFNNPAIFSQYEPGSIFKVITMAMGINEEKVTPQTTYEDTGVVKIAGYNIENSDHKANGTVNMIGVLEKSLNTGAIYVMRQVGTDNFASYVKEFGFGEKTGIELKGESSGDINNLLKEKINKELVSATASFGQGIAVTPLQMANAFAVIANNGIMMKPYVVKEIVKTDGTKIVTEPQQMRRVISERSAAILGGMMVNVVENGHGQKAGVKGYYVGGKTGTAQVPRKDGRGYETNAHIGSFAGFAPVNDPRFAMLVRIDNPRDVQWAESSAAPLFGQLAEFMLNYWQVPKERTIEEKKK